jgi:hypothetical protein
MDGAGGGGDKDKKQSTYEAQETQKGKYGGEPSHKAGTVRSLESEPLHGSLLRKRTTVCLFFQITLASQVARGTKWEI